MGSWKGSQVTIYSGKFVYIPNRLYARNKSYWRLWVTRTINAQPSLEAKRSYYLRTTSKKSRGDEDNDENNYYR